MSEKVLFVLKDDGNEGSNNSARKLVELFLSNKNKASILYLKKEDGKPLLFRKRRSIYLNHARLRKVGFFSSAYSILTNFYRLTCLFYSLRKRKIVINNATLLDVLIVSLVAKHETFVFLREVHLPAIFLLIIKLLSKFLGLKVLSNNHSVKNRIKSVDITVVNNYVDLHDHGVDLSSCKDKIKILSVGAIYPLKNQIALVEMAKSLVGSVDFEIDIYGPVVDEDYHSKLISMISYWKLDDFINIKGQVSNSELMLEYKNYHVFIQSSSFEGMSRALMDALSFGLYCIATDVGDTNRLFVNDCGLLVTKMFDDKDREAIKCKLIAMQMNFLSVSSDVAIARENIRINFSSKSCIKQLEIAGLVELSL
ncbi:glycosyltransferase [Vibrio misgurnus]|uniref:glycosyltransferase n=1 Tax=Vibrio misgurnus TaxID=2993714 RepID=UPI002416416D|nr:glycosyltransferase [Vibrio sp. gvc]